MAKATQFTESVIREMTRLNQLHGGVNLSQGFPDFPAPVVVKEAACAAIMGDVNPVRRDLGHEGTARSRGCQVPRHYGVPVVPDQQVTVCCGSTEAMMATMMAYRNPGDEVVIFEPFYENYGPDAILSGATPRYVTLREPDPGHRSRRTPAAAFNNRTKAIIPATPNNLTGKVFTAEELTVIARLCQQWDVVAISDEIYEHIVYDDSTRPIAAWTAWRAVTINSLSKDLQRDRLASGLDHLTAVIDRRDPQVHDFTHRRCRGAASGCRHRCSRSRRQLPPRTCPPYQRRRDMLLAILERHNFVCSHPEACITSTTDIAHFGFDDDVSFASYLVKDVWRRRAVPGSNFYKSERRRQHKLLGLQAR